MVPANPPAQNQYGRIPDLFKPKAERILDRYRRLLEGRNKPVNAVLRNNYNSDQLGRSYMDEFGGTNPTTLNSYLNSFIPNNAG
jgi:hypothetical protein